jgi:hypothetical protein
VTGWAVARGISGPKDARRRDWPAADQLLMAEGQDIKRILATIFTDEDRQINS